MGQQINTEIPRLLPGDEVILKKEYSLDIPPKDSSNSLKYIVYQIRDSTTEKISNENFENLKEVILIPKTNSSLISSKIIFPENFLKKTFSKKNKIRRIEFNNLKKFLLKISKKKIYSSKNSKFIIDIYTQKMFEGLKVKILNLKNLGIDDGFFKVILECLILNKNSNIISIKLGGNLLTDKSAKILGIYLDTKNFNEINGFKKISYLGLQGNNIGVKGAKELSKGLKKNKGLHVLNLENTNIGEEGVNIIIDSLNGNINSNIVKINFKGNKISDKAVLKALNLAKKKKSIVSIKLYKKNNENKEGWLGFDGWNNFLKLKNILKENQNLINYENLKSNSLDGNWVNIEKKNIFKKKKENYFLIDCKICLEKKNSEDIYIIDDCEHKFCFECLRNYVISKIKSFETDTIKCPQCNKNITPIEIKQILLGDSKEKETYDNFLKKFNEFSLKKALSKIGGKNEKLIWCPNNNCANAFLVNLSDFKTIKNNLQSQKKKKKENEIKEKEKYQQNIILQAMNPYSHEQIEQIKIQDKYYNKIKQNTFHPYTYQSTPNQQYFQQNFYYTPYFYHNNNPVNKLHPPPPILKNTEDNKKIQKKNIENKDVFPNENTQTQITVIKCRECLTEICAICLNESHNGVTCEESRNKKQNKNDFLFEKWRKVSLVLKLKFSRKIKQKIVLIVKKQSLKMEVVIK